MPPLLSYARFISELSARREPSAIRGLQALLTGEGTISLGGGMPNPTTFPIAGLTVRLRGGREVEVEGAGLEQALQYSDTRGLPALVDALGRLQTHYHATPAQNEQSLLVSTGSQDALTKTFECLLGDGDSLLVEEFTYSGSLAFLRPFGCGLVPVAADEAGMQPAALRRVLDTWDSARSKPKVLYANITGANPTGVTLSLQRRKELYAVAQTHDLLIIEDDPYYFMQFGEAWVPSLYSMDVDSRVVRFDSLSKIVSSGLRLGFMTGPKEIVDRVVLHQQATCLHTSGVSQAVALALLQDWERGSLSPSAAASPATAPTNPLAGFQAHVLEVGQFYRAQRDAFLRCATKHLTGLCAWRVPDAGMFLWVRVLNVESASAFCRALVEQEKVLVVTGSAFHPTGAECPFVRLSYSTATEAQMDEALSRMAALLRRQAASDSKSS